MKNFKKVLIYLVVFVFIITLFSSFVSQTYLNEAYYTSLSPKQMYFAYTDKLSDYLSGIILEEKKNEEKIKQEEQKEPDEYKIGDSSDGVLELQKLLYFLDYLGYYPDGNFDTDTENAVKAYQKATGLTQNGILNKETITALKSERIEYKEGKKGDEILSFNLKLYYLNYLKNYPTNEFDSEVKEAVKKYQTDKKFKVTGTYSLQTQEALNNVVIEYSEGKEGGDIEKYQIILKNKGYLTVEPDGKFGKSTKEAVLKYQKDKNIKQSGKLDKATMKALDAEK